MTGQDSLPSRPAGQVLFWSRLERPTKTGETLQRKLGFKQPVTTHELSGQYIHLSCSFPGSLEEIGLHARSLVLVHVCHSAIFRDQAYEAYLPAFQQVGLHPLPEPLRGLTLYAFRTGIELDGFRPWQQPIATLMYWPEDPGIDPDKCHQTILGSLPPPLLDRLGAQLEFLLPAQAHGTPYLALQVWGSQKQQVAASTRLLAALKTQGLPWPTLRLGTMIGLNVAKPGLSHPD